VAGGEDGRWMKAGEKGSMTEGGGALNTYTEQGCHRRWCRCQTESLCNRSQHHLHAIVSQTSTDGSVQL